MNYSKVQLGNMLLEALHKCRTSDGEGYYIKTQDLFDKVEYTNEWGNPATGLPVKFHQRCRGYLDDLYNAGVIDKWGTSVGQRKWKINVDEWEGVDPFKRVGDLKKPIEPVKQTFHESDPYDDRPSKEEYDRMKQEFAQVKTDMSNLHTAFGVVTNRVVDLTKEVESSKARVKELVVKQYQKKTVKLKDVVLPKVFDKVLALANCRRPILLVGPAGCLDPESLIYDPITGESATVEERHRRGNPFHVVSLDRQRGVLTPAMALSPVAYSRVPMYSVTTDTGKRFKVTSEHRLLTLGGYVRVRDVRSLLQQSVPVLLECVAADDQKVLTLSGRRSTRTAVSWKVGCRHGRHSYGERPLQGVNAVRDIFPSQVGVLEHIRGSSPPDDLFVGRERSRQGPSSDLLSNWGCPGLSTREEKDTLLLLEGHGGSPSTVLRGSEPWSDHSLYEQTRTTPRTSRPQTSSEGQASKLSWGTRIERIVAVEPAGYNTFYDFHVPGYCNYLMNGAIHHNCGKSHLAKLVADSLGLAFDAMSCTAGMSESHLLGRSVPDLTHGKNRFQGTAFLDRYEKGGLFLLDEMDAADPNLLLAINTALANGYCNVPNRTANPKAVQHDDFIAVATANTFGRGATRQYAGRSQLDEATLDRFRIGTVECDYDMAVEEAVCPDAALRAKCWDVRRKIEQAGLRRVMSTRFMADAHTMVSQAGWTIDDVMQQFVSGWTKEEVSKVLNA